MDIPSANTPEKLKKAIEKFLQSDYSQEELVKAYSDARKQANSIRVIYDAFPDVPDYINDPLDGLKSIRKWCKEADKAVDDIPYSLGQQTISKIISLFKKLRDFASKIRSLVDNELQIKIQNEINVEDKKKREQMEARIQAEIDRRLAQQKSTFAAEGIMTNIGAPLVIAAQAKHDILKDTGYILEVGEESKAVQSYLSKDPTFKDKLYQLRDEEINKELETINKLVGSNTPTRKLLDIYCKLKDIPFERQFDDVEYAYSLRDLDNVIFGNCSNLYASINTVIKTFEEIQTKAEQRTDLAEKTAGTDSQQSKFGFHPKRPSE